jgi:hypothetical protein
MVDFGALFGGLLRIGGAIEIALGAAVVRVGPGTDLATLTKVLRAVKAAT